LQLTPACFAESSQQIYLLDYLRQVDEVPVRGDIGLNNRLSDFFGFPDHIIARQNFHSPIGIPRSTFYGWYSRYLEGGIEALEDGKPRPRRIWNKIPDEIGSAIVNLALEEPDLSPRELAVNFTDTKGSLLKIHTALSKRPI
jgi:Homeodomain-like domain